MNPSTALALVVVDELVRCGVREFVLCPGSRSAPLAYAAQQADRDGRLRLHVRVDERSAAYLALGLGKGAGSPAAVLTTSGTAVANLLPAVWEADQAGVPLLVLTADRPPELRGVRANQTADQVGVFGAAARFSHDLGVPERRAGQQGAWRARVDRAVAAARGALGGEPGPAHLNLPLREPLVPDLGGTPDQPVADPMAVPGVGPLDPGVGPLAPDLGDLPDQPGAEPAAGRGSGADAGEGGPWPESLRGRAGGRAWTATDDAGASAAMRRPGVAGWPPIEHVPRTLALIGDLPDPADASAVARALRARGYPVLAEPFGTRDGAALAHAPLLAAASLACPALRPDRVLVVGRLTLSRAMAALTRLPDVVVELVTTSPRWPDPAHAVSRVYPWGSLAAAEPAPAAALDPAAPLDLSWLAAWEEAAAAVSAAIATSLEAWPTGPGLARAALSAAPAGAVLFLGSSNLVRDVDLARTAADGAMVTASRGLAGIDGATSTAIGLALSQPNRPHYALIGDLTFLHDTNALLIGPGEPRPDLTVIVANDDGGGIFTVLEPGEPARQADFERVFGTPTGVDLASLCRAHSVPHRRATSSEDLIEAMSAPPLGLQVVEVPLRRAGHRALQEALQAAARAALRPG